MDRRESLFLLSGLPAVGLTAKLPAPVKSSKNRLRIAHITDTHIVRSKNAVEHTRACLEKIINIRDKPDVIFHSGDVIGDAMVSDKASVTDQWKAWHEVSGDITIPIKYCIGNHDIWSVKGAEQEPLYGKKWAIQEMPLTNRYYSLKLGGWHFIFLDSTQDIYQGMYNAAIDNEQYEWLENELKSVPASEPIMIISHIPILSVSIFDWANVEDNNWKVKSSLMHSDSHRAQALFRNYPNVKVCISGHLHLFDTLKYDNVTYWGNGAVCANWWFADVFHNTAAGYAIIDLYEDGSFEREYKEFRWATEK